MSFGLFERIERVLERGVRESSSAAQRAAELEGATLRIRVEGLGLDVVLRVDGGRIRVVRDDVLAADATVRGTPLDLMRVLASGRASRLPGSAGGCCASRVPSVRMRCRAGSATSPRTAQAAPPARLADGPRAPSTRSRPIRPST